MVDDPIPSEVRDFILRHIDSIAQLEALLLLRNNPQDVWNIHTVAKRLYTAEQQVVDSLGQLCEDGLLSIEEGRYLYRGGSVDQRVVVDQLAAIYARHLIAVTNMIHSKPRRIRQFADAFKFRKDH